MRKLTQARRAHFDLGGRLRFMAGYEGASHFPAARDPLPQLPLHPWAGHGFLSLKPARDSGAWAGDMQQHHCGVQLRSFVADAPLLGPGAGGAVDPVEMEDEEAVASMRRGIRSRL